MAESLWDGTHFILTECGAQAAGRKLMAVNLSDLASKRMRVKMQVDLKLFIKEKAHRSGLAQTQPLRSRGGVA